MIIYSIVCLLNVIMFFKLKNKKGGKMSKIINFLKTHLSKELAVIIISMLPIVELRGAIPIGVSLGLGMKKSFILSYLGSIVPSIFIILLINWVFKLLSHIGFFERLIKKINEKTLAKSDQIQKYGYWGLLIFVAIPLPGTGVWSGSLVSVLLDLDKKKSFLIIALGNLIAGLIMAAISGSIYAILN